MKEEELTKLKLLIMKFKQYLEVEGYSVRTYENYYWSLLYFVDYLRTAGIDTITDISKEFKVKEIEIGKELAKGLESFRKEQMEEVNLEECQLFPSNRGRVISHEGEKFLD